MKKLLILFLAMLLTGCVEKEILDDINIEVAVGYDMLEDSEDKYRGTVLFQEFQPDKSVINRTFSGEGTIRQDIRMAISKQSSEPVVTGGLKLAIFGPEVVKKGMYDIVDSLQRDASIGARLFVATSDGKTEDLLKGEYGSRGNSTYIYNMISHNVEKRDIPKTNLHLAAHDFYQKGKDPFLPRLKQVSKDKVEISGISLFKDDKEVDILRVENLFFFKLLVDKYSEGNFDISVSKDATAAVKSIRSKHKIKILDNKADIKIKIRGVIREFTGDALTPDVIKKIEKNLEKEVETKCLKLLKRFQEQGIDPIGIGQLKKSQNRNFDFKKWEDDYKNMSFNVKCNVLIEETGVIE
ncbi:Ger(x)C family spore germination protein [Bacillus sp. ISL-47]|uniref:Ger(x)C family spore germination protein n=1 Tax=Bacillus sp. ISL-47 TaxID=2819130 RepID=UPI001BE907E9|nr:Ger(x)C family spore germination protein [Bacillus sp. ISL-47]MBT2687507.1 Ger(x)C family spore germination protein [Bacillus sp. ISL-47]MBT2706497.1 Ger(x)C family spore germination protein [Pseudomonas sp. ISL-84]